MLHGQVFRATLVEKGYTGAYAQRGHYDYREDKRGAPDPEIKQIFRELRARFGRTTTTDFSDQDVLEAVLLAMVNVGASIIEAGFSERPSDIDTVFIHGYGFPRSQGGPFYWADQNLGSPKVLERLLYFKALFEASLADPDDTKVRRYVKPQDMFEPCQLIRGLAEGGKAFGTLN